MPDVKFIDLFAGCGGLSLGLSMAGMKGVFAIEKDALAFKTFAANFLSPHSEQKFSFEWPKNWLREQAWSIHEFLRKHESDLIALQGAIDVIAGGPPCQGFSFAGRRDESDPRNKLFKEYVRVVRMVRPRALILENVPGMAVAHLEWSATAGSNRRSFFEKLKDALKDDYDVDGHIVNPVLYGVPQKRDRLIVIGIRRDIAASIESDGIRPGGVARAFHILRHEHKRLVSDLGFSIPATAADAISDLETSGAQLRKCEDPESPAGFSEVDYCGPTTDYQKLMHGSDPHRPMDSTRLANHRPHIVERFRTILRDYGQGYKMGACDRERFGLLKHRICTLEANAPSRTITTLPDDIIHYSEPRILTVRECARLQSFPDWFVFRGKFTTGGDRRTKECPRYTQVGNAVPPLLGRAVGLAVIECLNAASRSPLLEPGEAREVEQDYRLAA